METLDLGSLTRAVEQAAAFRCRRRLEPAGGEGDKVFPPTFAGALYAIEDRRILGRDQPVRCVLLDSVQSQANRMEQALQEAVDAGRLRLPLVVVDFSDYDPTGDLEADERAGRLLDRVGRITSLQVPHRLADAIIRDSELDGVPFRQSSVGRMLNAVSAAHATPLFELCPTALIFGMWDSTGPKGGLGPKFERALVSEVVGIGAQVGDLRRGVRRDPLQISKQVKVRRFPDRTWEIVEPDAKARDAAAPSEVNHSSVPFPEERDEKTERNYYDGVTIEYAEQTTTLSLIALRRLRFPVNGQATPEADRAARAVLAALGLAAAALAFEGGLGLRSRCLLWPEGPMAWELLNRPGREPLRFALGGDEAIALLQKAVAQAKAVGLPWREEPVVLKPSRGPRVNLVELVRRSQIVLATRGAEEGS